MRRACEEMDARQGRLHRRHGRPALSPATCRASTTDHLRELNYADRKALHNFKYFTWVEQQGRSADDLRQLWDEDFWRQVFSQDSRG